MKKEKKKNVYIEKLKELWAIPRYKSLMKLGLYLLFFTCIFLFIDFKDKDELYQNKLPKKATLDTLVNYEYQTNITYLLTTDEPIKTVHVRGKRYNNKQSITVEETGDVYYVENSHYYLAPTMVESTPLFFDFEKITPKQLSGYIEKATLNATTQYADKKIVKTYLLPISTFASLYKEETVPIEGNVGISTTTLDGNITEIVLDLSTYNQTKIQVLYNKIGEIKSFNKESLIEKSSF
ncbi:MAG: hypothetical protein PHN72_01815 [Bacilli bacterium]|nr:hypothetical protein [Bacilli bacterium]